MPTPHSASPSTHPALPHFDYVNPDAPKGGTINLRNPDRRSSFDKFNPFTTKGNSPAGLNIFMFESLAILGSDELQTMYGLLAEAMAVAPDKSSISFRLHPKARFTNGDPVTAEDVKYSFESMSGKYASPGLQAALAGVARVVVLDPRTVRFELRERTNDMLFTVGGLAVFSRKWALGPDGKPKRFDEIVSEYPLTSGPYTIAKADSGRRLEFRRNPDYWAATWVCGAALQLRPRGLPLLHRPGGGARGLQGRRVRPLQGVQRPRLGAPAQGREVGRRPHQEGPVRNRFGQGLQAYMLNMRRPLFQDIRVREALGYTYDFETINRLGLFKRAESQFNNSEFAAQGLPSPGELKLLEPFALNCRRASSAPPIVAPRTDATRSGCAATCSRRATCSNRPAGSSTPDGKLRNAKGEAFEFEYLSPGEGGTHPTGRRNLEKLGITMKERNVDFALYRARLEEYDFDMIAIAGGDFTLPDATAGSTAFGSKSADEEGQQQLPRRQEPRRRRTDRAMSAPGRWTTCAIPRARWTAS
jgi:microcin C transport system substrate-binding protein